jgi:hypothetical protein
MARIFRQRLAVGLSTLLDLGAVALFFIQSAVGDADWIKDEFLDYKFWESVSDLGILNVFKAFYLLGVYSIGGVTHLHPAVGASIVMSLAVAAKIIALVAHKASTHVKLPGLHFALPLFVGAITWVQLEICRFGRKLDQHHILQQTSHDTSSLGDYLNLQAEFPASQSVAVQQRRFYKETEPLLSSESLSNSVPITVLPSVPLHAPTLQKYASETGIGLGALERPPSMRINASSDLPPLDELVDLMRRTLPTKTHIRALKQISAAFTVQDFKVWLQQQFSTSAPKRSEVHSLLLSMIQNGDLELVNQSGNKNATADLDSSLFVFGNGQNPRTVT